MRRLVLAAVVFAIGCKQTPAPTKDTSISMGSSGTGKPESTISSWPATIESGTPKPGMAWIPAGQLKAGTPRDRTPRIADEEMAGTPIEMGGFYIDLLPWPNEPNAIPTSNVSRDEAEQLCTSKGKRLCSELEWERACKGPENTTYEYGDVYRKDVCGTGVAIELASRNPTGEHAQCKSRFGVSEMHGSVFEWTSSSWGRGSKDGSQGVLRGGNSVAGELVARCSNAIARAPGKKSPAMGFRCCSGQRNGAEVSLEQNGTPGLVMVNPARAQAWTSVLSDRTIDPKSFHAWVWTPAANEELLIALGCTTEPRTCGLAVVRESRSEPLLVAPTGKDVAEVVRNGDPRHLKFRSLDVNGVFSREITYAYGRMDLGEPKRGL